MEICDFFSCVARVLARHNVVAVERVARPMPRYRLSDLLRYARSDHIADGCTTKIVKNHSFVRHHLLRLPRPRTGVYIGWPVLSTAGTISPSPDFTHAPYDAFRKLSILTDFASVHAKRNVPTIKMAFRESFFYEHAQRRHDRDFARIIVLGFAGS